MRSSSDRESGTLVRFSRCGYYPSCVLGCRLADLPSMPRVVVSTSWIRKLTRFHVLSLPFIIPSILLLSVLFFALTGFLLPYFYCRTDLIILCGSFPSPPTTLPLGRMLEFVCFSFILFYLFCWVLTLPDLFSAHGVVQISQWGPILNSPSKKDEILTAIVSMDILS